MYVDKLTGLLGRQAAIAPLPLRLCYPPASLRREALKGGVGVTMCLATLVFLSPAPLIAWPVGAIGLVFLGYVAQQAWRRRMVFELDAQGVARVAGGPRRAIRWKELEGLRLKFYASRRRSLQGTLVLALRAGRTRFRLDSSLEDFPTLLLHAAAAARERDFRLDATTSTNLAQLGL